MHGMRARMFLSILGLAIVLANVHWSWDRPAEAARPAAKPSAVAEVAGPAAVKPQPRRELRDEGRPGPRDTPRVPPSARQR